MVWCYVIVVREIADKRADNDTLLACIYWDCITRWDKINRVWTFIGSVWVRLKDFIALNAETHLAFINILIFQLLPTLNVQMTQNNFSAEMLKQVRCSVITLKAFLSETELP